VLGLPVLLVKVLLNADYYALLADGGQSLKAMGPAATLEFYLMTTTVGLLGWAFLLFSIPRVFLDGVSPAAALGESIRAVLGNFLPLAAFFLAFIFIVVICCVVLGVATVVLVTLSILLGKIGAVVGTLLGLALFVVAFFATLYLMPAMYYPSFLMWRDVFGASDSSTPPPPPGMFEA